MCDEHTLSSSNSLIGRSSFLDLPIAGRSFGVYVEQYNITLPVPYANLFYSLYAVADFPAWGQQPATYWVAEAINAQARSGRYHTAFMVGDLAYAEGMSAHWDVSASSGREQGCAAQQIFAGYVQSVFAASDVAFGTNVFCAALLYS